MKTLDTLVDDIYDTLSCLCEQKDLEISDEAIEDFGERMKDVIKHWATPYKEAKGLRMSNVGRPMRQLWYDVKEDLPVFNRSQPQVFIKFLYGHMLEEVVLLLSKLAGPDVTNEQKDVEVDGIRGCAAKRYAHEAIQVHGQAVDLVVEGPGCGRRALVVILVRDDAVRTVVRDRDVHNWLVTGANDRVVVAVVVDVDVRVWTEFVREVRVVIRIDDRRLEARGGRARRRSDQCRHDDRDRKA